MKKILIIITFIFTICISFCFGFLFKEKIFNEKITSFNSENTILKEQIKTLEKQINEYKNQLESSQDKEPAYQHPIDIEEEKCIKSTHPYLYSDCAKKSEILWDIEIKKYVNLLNNTMNKDDIKSVVISQEIWKKSAQSDIKMINKFVSSRQGTKNETLGFSYISDIKKQRAILLEKIYENYTEESKLKNYQ